MGLHQSDRCIIVRVKHKQKETKLKIISGKQPKKVKKKVLVCIEPFSCERMKPRQKEMKTEIKWKHQKNKLKK